MHTIQKSLGLGTAYRFYGLAIMAQVIYDEAQAWLHKSLEVFGKDYIGWDIARTYSYLGHAFLATGETSDARKTYLEALQYALEANAVPIVMDCMLGLANLYALTGDNEKALSLSAYIIENPTSVTKTKECAKQIISKMERFFTPDQIYASSQRLLSSPIEDVSNQLIMVRGK